MSEGRGWALLAAIAALAAWAAMGEPVPLPIAAEQQRPEQSVAAQTQSTEAGNTAEEPPAPISPEIISEPEHQKTAEPATPENSKGIDWPTWIEAFSALGTFLFTGVLAVATVRLWNSTKGLHDETKRLAALAETQSKDMKDSIALSERSAKAAEAAVKVASDNARVELRAFILSDGFREFFAVDQRGIKPPGYMLLIVWHNIGATPALEVRYTLEVGYLAKDDPLERPVFVDDQRGGKTVFGPKAVHDSGKLFVPIEKMRECAFGGTRMWIYGRVEYRDWFDRNTLHLTEQCARVEFHRDPGQFIEGQPSAISFRIDGPQNGMS